MTSGTKIKAIIDMTFNVYGLEAALKIVRLNSGFMLETITLG